MRKARMLIGLGLILAAAVAIVGLAAPNDSSATVNLTVNVASSFTLVFDATTAALSWSGFGDDTLPSASVIATATSNWPKGYIITARADTNNATYISPTGESGAGIPAEVISLLLNNIKVACEYGQEGTLNASSVTLITTSAKTGKDGAQHTITFSLTSPDGDEYPGTYEIPVIFTMTANT